MVVVTYVLIQLLEWPLIAWCLRGAQDWLRQSIRASLVVQNASYVILFGWYWMASGTSLYRQMSIVAPADLSLPESVIVYFTDAADGHVYRRSLVDGGKEKVFGFGPKNNNDRLFVRPSPSGTDRWDLVARLETEDYNSPRCVDVLTPLAVPWRFGLAT